MAKGRKTGGGSRKGVPNHATAEVREAIAQFASANVHRMGEWLDAIQAQDPGKAMDLYLKALEYFVPKLARSEIAGDPDKPLTFTINAPWMTPDAQKRNG